MVTEHIPYTEYFQDHPVQPSTSTKGSTLNHIPKCQLHTGTGGGGGCGCVAGTETCLSCAAASPSQPGRVEYLSQLCKLPNHSQPRRLHRVSRIRLSALTVPHLHVTLQQMGAAADSQCQTSPWGKGSRRQQSPPQLTSSVAASSLLRWLIAGASRGMLSPYRDGL